MYGDNMTRDQLEVAWGSVVEQRISGTKVRGRLPHAHTALPVLVLSLPLLSGEKRILWLKSGLIPKYDVNCMHFCNGVIVVKIIIIKIKYKEYKE